MNKLLVTTFLNLSFFQLPRHAFHIFLFDFVTINYCETKLRSHNNPTQNIHELTKSKLQKKTAFSTNHPNPTTKHSKTRKTIDSSFPIFPTGKTVRVDRKSGNSIRHPTGHLSLRPTAINTINTIQHGGLQLVGVQLLSNTCRRTPVHFPPTPRFSGPDFPRSISRPVFPTGYCDSEVVYCRLQFGLINRTLSA